MDDELPEILIYMSDQHAPQISGFMGDALARTPNLDAIAADATVFEQAYTACPLCVPARAAMLTGRTPSDIGVFTNTDAYSSQVPTFLHSLALRGYETVLCGRMHFIGADQLHGFEKRIANDITPPFWGYEPCNRPSLGDFQYTLAQRSTLRVIGVGDSPTLSYDDYVVASALDRLERDDADRPQAMLVGTYGPHFPYVAPEREFAHYAGKTLSTLRSAEAAYPLTAIAGKMQHPSAKHLDELRATYYALAEVQDALVGEVHRAFRRRLARTGRRGVFVYLSDHGDQIGEKHFFGKQTFFEYSAKIPLLIAVDGAPAHRVGTPVSILDLGPTLCGLAGARRLPFLEGADHSAAVLGGDAVARPVVAEFYDRDTKGAVFDGYMVREGRHKFITYRGYEREDLLFDIAADPGETVNLAQAESATTERFRDVARQAGARGTDKAACRDVNDARSAFLDDWGRRYPALNEDTWDPPLRARRVEEQYKHPEYGSAR